jgi:DNA polymerase-3 subunit epsilon
MPSPVGQLSLDDLGTPLSQVTFCVIDLETTGGSAADCGITEIGAVKLQSGECLGTFQTLVNPGCTIPPQITVLTGITHAMVFPAPRIEAVLPSLLEFIGDAVIVGHNVRFDLSFIQAALERDQRPKLRNRAVDTVALARRLVRDEVPNCKLGTLAERLRLDHRPSHRALDDALATGDLLHLLIERARGLGVTGLDDLLALPTMAGHAQASKLRLTDNLPRSPGVYVFRNAQGDVLYVGKATNLRSRVRSYFSGDERRKVGTLLREAARIDHVVHPHPLSAAVHEIRLIHEHTPGYNRQSKDWGKYVYVKLTLGENFPRLSIVKDVRDDGALYLGPLPSRSMAQRVVDAIQTSVPLRRCTGRVGKRAMREAPCTAAQLGVSLCPCTGGVDPDDYARVVDRAVRGLTMRSPERCVASGASTNSDAPAAFGSTSAIRAAQSFTTEDSSPPGRRANSPISVSGPTSRPARRPTSSSCPATARSSHSPVSSPTSWRASPPGSIERQRRSPSNTATACSPRRCLRCLRSHPEAA